MTRRYKKLAHLPPPASPARLETAMGAKARDCIGSALAESFRIGHAVELLELTADMVGAPRQCDVLTDVELQQIGQTLEYLSEQMRGHNEALQAALHKAEG